MNCPSFAIACTVACSVACASPDRTAVLVPDGAATAALMDFTEPPSLDPMSPGWHHRTFRRHPPMDISFVTKEGRAAVRLATSDSASMLIRWVDVDLQRHLEFFGFFSFPQYTANGGDANVGRWHSESVDLSKLFSTLWGDPAGAHLTEIALFCDTDETGAESIAYFANVQVEARPGQER